MSLTPIQTRFLTEFGKSGEVDTAVESCGIETIHFVGWRNQSEEFDREFLALNRQIMQTLKEQAALRAMQLIHRDLMEGCIRTFETETVVRKDPDGEEIYTESKVKRKEHPIPAMHFKIALSEMTLSKALDVLMREGIIPTATRNLIESKVESITTEIRGLMGENEQDDSDRLTEEKAIDIVRKGIMGALGGG